MPEVHDQMRMNAHTQLVMLRRAIEQISSVDPELDTLNALLEKLGAHSYTVAVVGEFNRGKSTLINALLGMPVLPADVTPTTATVNRIVYADQPTVTLNMMNGCEERLPIQALAARITKLNVESEAASRLVREAVIGYPTVFCRDHVSILDTPGLNESEEMDELTLSAARQADTLIFVVHALIPYSVSEAKRLCHLLADASIQHIMFTVSFIDRVQQTPGMEERVLEEIRQRIQRLTLPLIEKNETWSAAEKVQKKEMVQTAPVLGVSAQKALDAFVSGSTEALALSRIERYKTELMTRLTAQQYAWEERELLPYLSRGPVIFQEAVERRRQSLCAQIATASSHLQNARQRLTDLPSAIRQQTNLWYNAVVNMPLPQEEQLLRDCFQQQNQSSEEFVSPHELLRDPMSPSAFLTGVSWLRQKAFKKGVYRDGSMPEGKQLRVNFGSAKERMAEVWIPAVNANAAAQYDKFYSECRSLETTICQELRHAALALHMKESTSMIPQPAELVLLKDSAAIKTLSFPVWGNLDKIEKASERLRQHLRKSFREWIRRCALYEKIRIFPDEKVSVAHMEKLAEMERRVEELNQQLAELSVRTEEVRNLFFGATDQHSDTTVKE